MSPLRTRRGDAGWLVTFADLSALLFGFFVLNFSMMEVDSGRWATLRGELSPHGVPLVVAPPEPAVADRSLPAAAVPLPAPGYLVALVQTTGDLAERLRVVREGDPLVLDLRMQGLPSVDHLAADGSAVAVLAATGQFARRFDLSLAIAIRRAGDESFETALARVSAIGDWLTTRHGMPRPEVGVRLPTTTGDVGTLRITLHRSGSAAPDPLTGQP